MHVQGLGGGGTYLNCRRVSSFSIMLWLGCMHGGPLWVEGWGGQAGRGGPDHACKGTQVTQGSSFRQTCSLKSSKYLAVFGGNVVAGAR